MRVFFLLLFLGLTVGAARAAEIDVSDQATLSPDQFGILPGEDWSRAPSWRGSRPKTVSALLSGLIFTPKLPLQNEILATVLTVPVSPDAEDNVPKHWLNARLDTLERIGARQPALALIAGLPESLMKEPLARRYADFAFLDGNVKRGCGIVEQAVASWESVAADAGWQARRILCLYRGKTTTEADLALQLLKEQDTKLSPFVSALIEHWQDTKHPLPGLASAPADALPLLTAALSEPKLSPAALPRVPGNFLTGIAIPNLPPALARGLSAADSQPLEIRAALMEAAARRGAMPPDALRETYHQIAALDAAHTAGINPELRERALLVKNSASVGGGTARITALMRALDALKPVLSARQARAFFAETLDEMRRQPDYYAVSPDLAVELFAEAAERENLEGAQAVLQYLAKHTDNAAMQATHTVLAQALALLHPASAAPPPVLPDPAKTPLPARTIWLIARYNAVLTALEQPVPPQATSYAFAAPAPRYAPPSPDLLAQLDAAEKYDREAEALLLAMLLLGENGPEYTSDTVLSRVIATLHRFGFDTQARAFAAAALYNPPYAPRP